jgi:hypothetical protein
VRLCGLAVAIIAVVAVAGCNVSLTTPAPSHTPVASPSPAASPTADETYLLSGIRPVAAIGWVPVRCDLPGGATAAVQCAPNDVAVNRFRVTLFSSTGDALALYLAEMTAHGVALNSGTCFDGQGESTYMPGPDDASVPYRNGCFVGDVAQYRALLPDAHVYIAIAGKSSGVSKELDTFAWEGNQDVPGAPTLWRAP